MNALVRQIWSLLVLAGLALLAALPVSTWDRTPSVCLWRNLVGVRCLGCGGTHAVAALLHGDVALALRYNPLAPFVALGLTIAAVRDLIPSRWRPVAALLRGEFPD